MKIQLLMKDENGVAAQLVVEGVWHALDVENVEKVENFEPVSMMEIVLFRDNGNIYRYLKEY
jgi:hypothetical protein